MSGANQIHIDARGMKCPRPIVELAKARRQAAEGTQIEIVADDLAFESDVRAWCDTTGSTLADLQKEGTLVTALIRIPGGD
jgi:TusA-related sulfurtransferase